MQTNRRKSIRFRGTGDMEVLLNAAPTQVADFSLGGTRMLVNLAVDRESLAVLTGNGIDVPARVLACDSCSEGWNGTGFIYRVRCRFERVEENRRAPSSAMIERLFGMADAI